MYYYKLINNLIKFKSNLQFYNNCSLSNLIYKYNTFNLYILEKLSSYYNNININTSNKPPKGDNKYYINTKFINKFELYDEIQKNKIHFFKITVILQKLIKLCKILTNKFIIITNKYHKYIYKIILNYATTIIKKKHFKITSTNKVKSNKYRLPIYINIDSIKKIFLQNKINKSKNYIFKQKLQNNINKKLYDNSYLSYKKNQYLFNIFYNNTKNSNKSEYIYDILYNFYQNTKKLIFGQNDNITQISRKLLNLKNNNYNKPIVSWLLCGPSGTGKTEISKILSYYINKEKKNLIHLDMSEYMEPHSISKLIGSPPGYVGSEETSKLIHNIKKNPDSVVLFDEIEKADKSIYSIFLQILDEGILTDSKGLKGVFNKSIIIFTSNIGSNVLNSISSNNQIINTDYENKINIAIKKHFKPEFINRLDDIIIFNPLNSCSLYLIINKLKNNKISIKMNNSVKSLISLISYSPIKGSRFVLNNINKLFYNCDNLENTTIHYNKLIKCNII